MRVRVGARVPCCAAWQRALAGARCAREPEDVLREDHLAPTWVRVRVRGRVRPSRSDLVRVRARVRVRPSLRPWLASTIASAFWKRSLACGAASFRSTVLVTRPVFASCASTAFRAATCLGLGLGVGVGVGLGVGLSSGLGLGLGLGLGFDSIPSRDRLRGCAAQRACVAAERRQRTPGAGCARREPQWLRPERAA